MANLCTSCGNELKPGVAFCTNCGAKAAQSAPQQKPAPAPQPAPIPQPETKVLGVGGFFGLMALFAFPVIGWIVALIMAFAPQNRNIKNYARATLIWVLIGIVLCVAVYFLGKGLVAFLYNSLLPS